MFTAERPLPKHADPRNLGASPTHHPLGVTRPRRGPSHVNLAHNVTMTGAERGSVASARMARVRQRDTAPELALRRELHRRGRRYFVNRSPLGGRRRADIVFPSARVAIFVDGCFWHSCPLHGTYPRSNASWWRDKLAANVARDRDTDVTLTAAGWLVIRVWEHEDVADAADIVEAALAPRVRTVT